MRKGMGNCDGKTNRGRAKSSDDRSSLRPLRICLWYGRGYAY